MIETESDSGLVVSSRTHTPFMASERPFTEDQPQILGVVNDTGMDTDVVLREAMRQSPEIAALQDALVTWSSGPGGWNSGGSRAGTLYDRDRFVRPCHYMDKLDVARLAAKDDVVAAFLDSSEALAFSRMAMEVDDVDESSIWEQILENMDLESRMREIWRELRTFSTCTVATWYGQKQFKVKGKSETGTKRKKVYDLTVPLGLTILQPEKVIPVGNFLFQQEQLAYYADATEQDVIDSWLLGDDDSGADEIIARLIMAKYMPDYRDRKELGKMVDPNRLYLMNPQMVFRINDTKPGYERWPEIRMESIFELLDLKRQLKAHDRALLIGATSYIVLLTKGSDKEPAKAFEISQLQNLGRSLSKIPILVGDHRLHVEIITPKTDNVLDPQRYGSLDLRIQGRLYGMFITASMGRDDSLKLAKVAARGLESRRTTQKNAIMRKIFNPTFDMNPLNAPPDLKFHPKRISLDFDPSVATYLLDLRDRGDLSRDSILSEVDYDEAEEARKKQIEQEKYDIIFQPGLDPKTGQPWATGGKSPSESINYKDTPPDVKRQLEKQAGLVPSKIDPKVEMQQDTPAKAAKPVRKAVKKAPPANGLGPVPGAPNDPKRAGRALGGNHGKGGNGNLGRGAGQEPRPGHPSKGIVGQPKLQKASEEEDD